MTTEKRKAFLINVAYLGVYILLAFLVLRYLLPMLAPFVAAFVIAYVLRPLAALFRKRLRLPARLSAMLAVFLFYGLAGLLLSLLGLKAISGLANLVSSLPLIYETHILPFSTDILWKIEAAAVGMDASLGAIMDRFSAQIIQSMGQMAQDLSVFAMGFVTGTAAAIPGLFIKLVLMIISTFFIAIDYEQLTGFCLRQMSEESKKVFLQIKEYLVGTLCVCIGSYALIMFITFIELSLAFTLVGISHAVLVAACISIFDILPVLGTGGIMIPWAVLTAVQGNFAMALKLLLIYVIITVIRNILEPKIVGGQLGLHPVITLGSMFLGVQLFGVIGLFGFPIGLSLLRYLNDHGVIRIFK